MIRSPLSVRLDPSRPIREQIRLAAEAGAKGIIIDASGELAPSKLSESGRREVRHLFRSVEVVLAGVHLPTRRGFDTFDQIEDRLGRADRAFELAYDLGARLILVRAGSVPPSDEETRRAAFDTTIGELAQRADHRGLQVALETGTEPGEALKTFLDGRDLPNLAASIDPAYLLRNGFDPVLAVRDLGRWVAHAYLHQAVGQQVAVEVSTRRNARSATGLDWENYFGALEEINYRGWMTIWPESSDNLFGQFRKVAESLRFA